MQRATPATPDPTVTVVIPVKDDAAELHRCLTALAAQTRAPDEILVVDNASTDASGAVASAHGVRLIHCATPGTAAASAAGYDAASGDVLLRLDADCIPDRQWVEVMLAACVRDPGVAAWTGGALFLDGPRPLRRPLATAYLLAYALVCGSALGHAPLFGSNLALRRWAWRDVRDRVHRDDPEVHDDLDLAFHLGERHRIRWAREAGMGISMRPFHSGRSFARRVHRGVRTVLIHWPEDFPPVRWTRLALRRTLHRLGVAAPARSRS
ncbi:MULTISPECIES: glycosyltransferase family A protein [Microbacterium]|uniref:glycosyltransferase family A protein n=1 Tax=Microbacterium TaxID=33882 RepID=UPI001F1086A3|nr:MULTISPECIES: glycosyltransferase family 2 protein [Microbacterium]